MNPVCVIMPTHGRAASARQALKSIARQDSGLIDEIVVVCDGDYVDDRLAGDFPDVKVLCSGGRRGPAAARNLGAAACRAEHLVFVDDDVVLAEGALTQLVQCMRKWERPSAWTGRIVAAQSVPSNCYVKLAYADVAHTAETHGVGRITFWHYCTSFAGISRDLFEKIGGFDESFDRPGYEDVEFAYRAEQMGAELGFCSDAVAFHLREMDRSWFIGRCETSGPLLRHLHDIHPGTRKKRHVLAHGMRCLRPLYGLSWRIMKRALPVVERVPIGLAAGMLRTIHTLGVTHSFLVSPTSGKRAEAGD